MIVILGDVYKLRLVVFGIHDTGFVMLLVLMLKLNSFCGGAFGGIGLLQTSRIDSI